MRHFRLGHGRPPQPPWQTAGPSPRFPQVSRKQKTGTTFHGRPPTPRCLLAAKDAFGSELRNSSACLVPKYNLQSPTIRLVFPLQRGEVAGGCRQNKCPEASASHHSRTSQSEAHAPEANMHTYGRTKSPDRPPKVPGREGPLLDSRLGAHPMTAPKAAAHPLPQRSHVASHASGPRATERSGPFCVVCKPASPPGVVEFRCGRHTALSGAKDAGWDSRDLLFGGSFAPKRQYSSMRRTAFRGPPSLDRQLASRDPNVWTRTTPHITIFETTHGAAQQHQSHQLINS